MLSCEKVVKAMHANLFSFAHLTPYEINLFYVEINAAAL